MRHISIEPPPFFHRGPSPLTRLAFFGLLSLALLFADTRYRYLENLRQAVAVLLYPVQRGSGMKVKVLEAMACGVPVVTTADGAEGIAPTPGVLVEHLDSVLVESAAELLRDPTARAERGAAGRESFLTRYTPGPATAPLADLLERMAGSVS